MIMSQSLAIAAGMSGTVIIPSDIASVTTGDNANVTLLVKKLGEKFTLTIGTNSNINAVFLPEPGTTQRTILLNGENSQYHEHTILIGRANEQFAITNTVVNVAPKTKASVFMTGVLDNTANASLIGTMRIPFGSRKATSHLTQHVLLLSNDARADVVPNMEIIENDVSAGHAATVRPLDEDSLFYLRSRGITDKDARQMLIEGFLQPALNELPTDVRVAITQNIQERLTHVLLS